MEIILFFRDYKIWVLFDSLFESTIDDSTTMTSISECE